MKRVLLLLVGLILSVGVLAQQEKVAKDTAPYLKYPTMPAIQILLQDSATIFNTYTIPRGAPTVLVFFSPDCEHCQHMTAEMVAKMDSMKQANFIFLTPMPLAMLRPFSQKMGINKVKNIRVVGKDYQYFFPAYYDARYVPIVVVYDKEKQFVKRYEGTVKVSDLISVVRGL